jgi:tetratricopeptide (TPR) repeat protein/predicted Ser/Thr protein kinase
MRSPEEPPPAEVATAEPAQEPAASAQETAEPAQEPVASNQEPMAKIRPGEAAGERLARARVLGALFGHERTAGAFGRFRVLERLGAGGMGVVYEAYDPDLARGVALKLVDVAGQDRGAALAEAQALARLSHPNVVPIYDVGLDGDQVYLVMELVRGRPLDRWPAPPTRRAVLEAYRQAGAALAAAHEAGLVHRDFKPANAILGEDGRVRVIDFGLACEADEAARPTGRPAAGTVGFMAPEVASRAAVTSAADQYSFCVALAGALAQTEEPTQRWLGAVLERGRAADPAARYPSMHELLRALARDPARTRRRAAAIGGLAATVGALAFLLGQRSTGAPDALAVCDVGAAELEAAWPPIDRAAALDRVAGLSTEGLALRERLAHHLDDYASWWVAEYRVACRDWRRGTWGENLTGQRLACLGRAQRSFKDMREAVAAVAPANLFALQTAVVAMKHPARCADDALDLASTEPPPTLQVPRIERVRERLEHARVQIDFGRYLEADREAAAAVEAAAAIEGARGLPYAPLLAEALLASGHARMLTDRARAVDILRKATTIAIRARLDAVAIEAWARRIWAQSTSAGPGAVLPDLEIMPALAERTPSAEFARALLYNNLGTAALARDDLQTARARFEQADRLAQSIQGRRDRHRLELLAARSNRALVTNRATGNKLLDETVQEWTELLGEDHPSTLDARWMRGTVTTELLADALALLEPICSAYQRYPTLAHRAARCWVEVGLLCSDLDRPEEAKAALDRATHATPSPTLAALGYLALIRDADPAAAAARFAGALVQVPPGPNESWWDRLTRAELTLGLGRALHAQGKLHEARAALETAMAELEAINRTHPAARHERQLGRARIHLMHVRSALGAPPGELAPIENAALDWLRRAGGTPAQRAELSRLGAD